MHSSSCPQKNIVCRLWSLIPSRFSPCVYVHSRSPRRTQVSKSYINENKTQKINISTYFSRILFFFFKLLNGTILFSANSDPAAAYPEKRVFSPRSTMALWCSNTKRSRVPRGPSRDLCKWARACKTYTMVKKKIGRVYYYRHENALKSPLVVKYNDILYVVNIKIWYRPSNSKLQQQLKNNIEKKTS